MRRRRGHHLAPQQSAQPLVLAQHFQIVDTRAARQHDTHQIENGRAVGKTATTFLARQQLIQILEQLETRPHIAPRDDSRKIRHRRIRLADLYRNRALLYHQIHLVGVGQVVLALYSTRIETT